MRQIDDHGLWVERTSDADFRGQPVLFLDRDGVLVEDTDYLGAPEDVRHIDGVAEAIAHANSLGVAVVLVTNQSGIGRGYYDWTAFSRVQEVIQRHLRDKGARLDLVLACAYHGEASPPYRKADHPWRKPNPGMLTAALDLLGTSSRVSMMVGDRASDMAAGVAAGVTALALVGGREEERRRLDEIIAHAAAGGWEGIVWADRSAGDAINSWLEGKANHHP
jgi:D-glycero-D-manno-heptose 1,7-bisphosphate phosphatase